MVIQKCVFSIVVCVCHSLILNYIVVRENSLYKIFFYIWTSFVIESIYFLSLFHEGCLHVSKTELDNFNSYISNSLITVLSAVHFLRKILGKIPNYVCRFAYFFYCLCYFFLPNYVFFFMDTLMFKPHSSLNNI